MAKETALKFMLAAALALGGTAVTAQNQARPEGQDHAQGSRMMMRGHHGGGMNHGMMGRGMMMAGMDGGMMGGMCPMMRGIMGSGMGRMMGPGMMGGMGSGMMGMGGANLTDEQQQKLADLHAEQAREHFLLMQKIQAPRQKLQELMAAEQPDVEAVSQTYDQLAELRKQALISRLETRQQMQQIVGQGQQQAMGQMQRPDEGQ